jgi:S1-C subfamily serine protease
MLGFNWIDVIIIVLLILAVVEGARIGFLTQLFALSGFFGALFVAGWIFPYLLPIHDDTLRTIVNASLVLLTATYAGMRSFDLGQKVHWSFRLGKLMREHKLKLVETVLGSLPGIVGGLALVWLLGVMVGRLPFAGLSNSVSDARIVQTLTRKLPPVPAVFAQFDRRIDPNSQPYVFARPKVQPNFNYSVADAAQAESKVSHSIVRITSFGCGGIVSATGFAIGPGLVATNAHVIAGVKRPIIKYNGDSYEGVPVYFNANLDLAVLRVPGLSTPALTLSSGLAALNTTVAIAGYPGGNYRAVPGLLRDTRAVSAQTIYDQGTAGRGVYLLQADVEYGSSGSPVVLPNGQVVAIIFSKSLDPAGYAYALTSPYIAAGLHRAESSYRRINTGACMVE